MGLTGIYGGVGGLGHWKFQGGGWSQKPKFSGNIYGGVGGGGSNHKTIHGVVWIFYGIAYM